MVDVRKSVGSIACQSTEVATLIMMVSSALQDFKEGRGNIGGGELCKHRKLGFRMEDNSG